MNSPTVMHAVANPKTREWSGGLYDRATEFHGHGGPFMVIGLRMGLEALRFLDSKGWFGIRCTAMLRWRPPDSCVIDGIQVSTGCTTGKHNLDIIDQGGVAAIFETDGKSVTIHLRDGVLENLRIGVDENHLMDLSRLVNMPTEALFDITSTNG